MLIQYPFTRCSCMRFYIICSLLFSLCLVLIFSGCGNSVEESDANVLEPDADFFRFQELPIVERGSLIPLDEIPVITIEKTREDAENVWWRLKADPVPTREDLVVGVLLPDHSAGWFAANGYLFDDHGYSPYLLYVAIPKFENSSVEMRAPRRASDYNLSVDTPWSTIVSMIEDWVEFLADTVAHRPERENFASVDLPPIRLSNGYVVPQGFEFSYYLVGTPYSLEISDQELAQ